jgi:hypothetical protein
MLRHCRTDHRSGCKIDRNDAMLARAETGILSGDGAGSAVFIGADGAHPISQGAPTGGWAEFGYDDGPDVEEQRGR